MMEERPEIRVAVTGIGVLSSIGTGVDAFWESLASGKSGIGPVTRFDPEAYTSRVASEVNDFDPSDYMDPKEARRNDRYTQFAVGAAKLAVEDSSIDLDNYDKSRVGVLVGSGIGGLGTIERQVGTLLERGPRKVSPFMIPSLIHTREECYSLASK